MQWLIDLFRQFAGFGCDEYEGDCDDDNDCNGNLVCGKNNCLKYEITYNYFVCFKRILKSYSYIHNL